MPSSSDVRHRPPSAAGEGPFVTGKRCACGSTLVSRDGWCLGCGLLRAEREDEAAGWARWVALALALALIAAVWGAVVLLVASLTGWAWPAALGASFATAGLAIAALAFIAAALKEWR